VVVLMMSETQAPKQAIHRISISTGYTKGSIEIAFSAVKEPMF
jgi:hypothetical protein